MSTEEANNLTASSYLSADERAALNGADSLRLSHIRAALKASPENEARLSCELLGMASQAITATADPTRLLMHALAFARSAHRYRPVEFLASLQRIIVQCFDRIGPSGLGSQKETLSMALTVALAAMRATDKSRFEKVVDSLRKTLTASRPDSRLGILADAGMSDEDLRSRIRRLRVLAKSEQLADEAALRSHRN